MPSILRDFEYLRYHIINDRKIGTAPIESVAARRIRFPHSDRHSSQKQNLLRQGGTDHTVQSTKHVMEIKAFKASSFIKPRKP